METRVGEDAATATGPPPIRHLSVSRKARNPKVTRLELAVLLVMVAVLAGIVTYATRGISSSGTVAACESNARLVGTSVTALEVENTGTVLPTSAAWRGALLPGSEYVGAPYLKTWPTSHDYVISVAGAHPPVDTGDNTVPSDGDVVVTVASSGRSYDANVHPISACMTV